VGEGRGKELLQKTLYLSHKKEFKVSLEKKGRGLLNGVNCVGKLTNAPNKSEIKEREGKRKGSIKERRKKFD